MGVLLPRFGEGHTPGLSTAELSVGRGGAVDARFVFTTAEPLGDLRLDRDGDGDVDEADITASHDALAAFVRDGVDVTADGDACPGTFDGATLTEVDGLELRATYACPADATAIGLTLYYLSRLPPGHREIARIALDVEGAAPGSDATPMVEGVLRGDRRALLLTLPPGFRPTPSLVRRVLRGAGRLPRVSPVVLALGTLVVVALLAVLALVVRAARGRAVRRRRPRTD